jgi:hypothetical protein
MEVPALNRKELTLLARIGALNKVEGIEHRWDVLRQVERAGGWRNHPSDRASVQCGMKSKAFHSSKRISRSVWSLTMPESERSVTESARGKNYSAGNTTLLVVYPIFCTSWIAFAKGLATNSGPLSERRCSGMPFITITSASASITLALLHRRSGRTSRLSLSCSSIRFNIRTVLPSCVLALTKS